MSLNKSHHQQNNEYLGGSELNQKPTRGNRGRTGNNQQQSGRRGNRRQYQEQQNEDDREVNQKTQQKQNQEQKKEEDIIQDDWNCQNNEQKLADKNLQNQRKQTGKRGRGNGNDTQNQEFKIQKHTAGEQPKKQEQQNINDKDGKADTSNWLNDDQAIQTSKKQVPQEKKQQSRGWDQQIKQEKQQNSQHKGRNRGRGVQITADKQDNWNNHQENEHSNTRGGRGDRGNREQNNNERGNRNRGNQNNFRRDNNDFNKRENNYGNGGRFNGDNNGFKGGNRGNRQEGDRRRGDGGGQFQNKGGRGSNRNNQQARNFGGREDDRGRRNQDGGYRNYDNRDGRNYRDNQRNDNGDRNGRNNRNNQNNNEDHIKNQQNKQQIAIKVQKIQPKGQKSWPQMSIYIKQTKLSISYRQITEYQVDIIVMPYKDTQFTIYPGNLINKFEIDYRTKIQTKIDQGKLKNQTGAYLFQKCVGLNNFKAIQFIQISDAVEKNPQLHQRMIQYCKKVVGQLGVGQNISILIPYSSAMGELKQIIRYVATSLQKVQYVSQVIISTNDAQNYKKAVTVYGEYITNLINTNRISIDV